MTLIRRDTHAFGAPGIEPRWTRGGKDAIGTACTRSSRVWYTAAAGVLTEIYYPTIDRPQTRDLQFLVTDGETFFHDERRHTICDVEPLAPHSLGLRMTNREREGRYTIFKEVIANPEEPVVLVRTRFEPDPSFAGRLRLFVLLGSHLELRGRLNNANVAVIDGRSVLTAHSGDTWLAMGATVPFSRASCGFVGRSDGWTDLDRHRDMVWQFDAAEGGNVALTGELDLSIGTRFTLGLAFGRHIHDAATALFQSLATPFEAHARTFNSQWERACGESLPLGESSGDDGALYRSSHSVLRAHEDKDYPGAMIASLSIPWGESKGDEDLGGYHLVWPRDMVNTTTALLASGNRDKPLRALTYLAVAQRADGGFNQNFWLNGEPYWKGIQLDEVAFPVLLAWRLHREGALRDFDPYGMVLRAAAFLIREGPATQQERWEENPGYSPSTLAVNIAALTCAARFADERGEPDTAVFLQEYADFLECHVEAWTVTDQGTLVPDIPRHFIRIHPVDPADPRPDEDPNGGMLTIKNRRPDERSIFPAKEIVDAGFLELVRYGVRRAGDPLIEDSLRVVDSVLKIDTPAGPTWRRYNHDGYGQGPRGEPFTGTGVGRGWPLLTGERGHYELAAGRDPGPYLRAMERFANGFGLLTEQVWDGPDLPEAFLFRGGPTGAAMPLCWAHAEYVKLLRSVRDGRVFDLIDTLAERYCERRGCRRIEIWKHNRQVSRVLAGFTLRILAAQPFRLRITRDEWMSSEDRLAVATSLGIHYVDVQTPASQAAPLRFTFHWPAADRWEGRDYRVDTS